MIVELKDLVNFDQYATGMRARSGAKVVLTCSCKEACPIDQLYYTSGKFSLVCKNCSSQVIDTYYCPCTLNSFFSSMAFQAKNRCPQCAACPTCTTTLSAVSRGSDYILCCEFCKWSSEGIGLTAASAAVLFDKIREHEDASEAAKEFEQLINHYGKKQLAKTQLDEDEEEDLEGSLRGKKNEYNDVQAAVSMIEKTIDDKQAALHRLPKEPVDNGTAPGNADQASKCTITQRLDQAGPPGSPDALWPRLVPLRTKLGRRAPDGRFVIKPKAGANKTSFDIQNLAMAVLPTVTLGLCSEMKKNEPAKILIYFKNPLDVPVKMTFTDLESALEKAAAQERQRAQDEDEGVLDDGDDREGPAKLSVRSCAATASVKLPGEVMMKAFDEIAEQNDIFAAAGSKAETDSDDVGFRKCSKVGVYFEITPMEDAGDVQCSFVVNLEVDLPAGGTKTVENLPFERCSFHLDISLGSMQ